MVSGALNDYKKWKKQFAQEIAHETLINAMYLISNSQVGE